MKFVRTVKLFFREGNSDKTYEIDLCEVGPDQYLVNFRYGKRGANLKEGTKTTSPVPLATANSLFDGLEKEKRSKGYIGEQESASKEQLTDDASAAIIDGISNPRHKAILRRLQNRPAGKHAWKMSRVIWRAGELRIGESAPFIIKQGDKKDVMHRYSVIWSLSRTGDATAIPVLKAYMENSAYPLNIRMLAANGMLMLLPEDEKPAFLQPYLHAMPDHLKAAVLAGDTSEIFRLLNEYIVVQQASQYPLLEESYLLSTAYPALRQALLILLTQVAFRPSWFQHLRHIFKQAEMKDDHMVVAALAHRIEREPAMFTMPAKEYEEWRPETFIAELNAFVKVRSEIKKPGSRIAFSHKTRRYFNRRVLRRLKRLGSAGDKEYVRFATALLLQYVQETDATKPYHRRDYAYVNNRYTTIEKQFPENSKAIFLNYIIRGNATDLQYLSGMEEWMFKVDTSASTSGTPRATANPDLLKKENNSLLKKLFSWLNTDKHVVPQPGTYQPESAPAAPVHSDVPFQELWNDTPEAFIQMLIGGKMDQVHVFAMEQLKAHPRFEELKSRITEDVIAALLYNKHHIPSLFGLELAREKYNPAAPSAMLLRILLICPLKEARDQAMEWISANPKGILADNAILQTLIFNPYEEVRQFVVNIYPPTDMPAQQAQVLAGLTIAHLMQVEVKPEAENLIITDACRILESYCGSVFRQLDVMVIYDLMQRNIVALQAFGVRLLLLKADDNYNFDQISTVQLMGILNSEYGPLRDAAWSVVRKISDAEMLRRPEMILDCLLSKHKGIRRQMATLVARLITVDNRLAVYLVNELVPLLMRTEKSEGSHEDIAALLRAQLADYLHDIDTASALRLLYANYRPAQEFGILLLDKYIPADTLTLKQIIATGAHELQQVREWCWNFYRNNVARIRAEKDTAVALLDSKWDDTRRFAIDYFRHTFTEADWSPESLIALADSVRTDIQAFGRELLMRYFKNEDGTQYLLKLSQHPSAAMQIFATSYLQTYASGQLEYIKLLEHYFRSVLTRVNKARVAKERVFTFLETEALKSAEAAAFIGGIITDISATVAIGDKARCISIMRNISQHFTLELPIVFVEPAVRLQ
ncbi:hypothetical protein [Chitinophaga sp. sic0106]|uniref:hypothetical protein n=1 Tax=Chitinophaga sp. sic0106 TaxID=2854785 RepID=UPI001C445A1D|nr:hypothetical protein [Chitinophaga sp. sic0106]MBV7531986.1 hypothetical protein [Chitinophaga sp. sic0106]